MFPNICVSEYSHGSEYMYACIYMYCVHTCACLMAGVCCIFLYVFTCAGYQYTCTYEHGRQDIRAVNSVASGAQQPQFKSEVNH